MHNGVTSSFAYGPDGLRRTATTGGITTQFILDGQNVAQEVSPSGVVSYLWGPRGPEARIDPAGNALWFLYDGHGNVLGEVNNDGVLNPDGVIPPQRVSSPPGAMCATISRLPTTGTASSTAAVLDIHRKTPPASSTCGRGTTTRCCS